MPLVDAIDGLAPTAEYSTVDDSDLPICDICDREVPLSPAGRRMKRHKECRASSGVPSGSGTTGAWQKRLEAGLTDMGQGLGMVIGIVDAYDGQVIQQGIPTLAHALIRPAEQNAKVRKALTQMVEGGVWGAVLVAAFPIVIPILIHHGVIPQPPSPAPPPRPEAFA